MDKFEQVQGDFKVNKFEKVWMVYHNGPLANCEQTDTTKQERISVECKPPACSTVWAT